MIKQAQKQADPDLKKQQQTEVKSQKAAAQEELAKQETKVIQEPVKPAETPATTTPIATVNTLDLIKSVSQINCRRKTTFNKRRGTAIQNPKFTENCLRT